MKTNIATKIDELDLNMDTPEIVETPNGIFRVRKGYDEFADNPREYDDLSTMVCWHRNYSLGEEHTYDCPDTFLSDLMFEHFTNDELMELLNSGKYGLRMTTVDGEPAMESNGRVTDYYTEEQVRLGWPAEDFVEELGMREKMQLLREREDLLILPCYLIDHSGLAMSVNSFNDPWDSGQVGYIYTTRARFGNYVVGCAPKEWKAVAEKRLQQDVEVYSQYLEGSCYYVSIDKWCGPDDVEPEDFISAEPYWDDAESCGGFLGYDDKDNGVLDYVCEITGLAA